MRIVPRTLFVLVIAFLCKVNAYSQTGSEIIEKMNDQLRRYDTFSASFEKEFYWAALDKSRRRLGQIFMGRPNRFRVQLDNGDTMVADGKNVWSYVERNRQVIVSDYEHEMRTPWQIFGDYSTNYTPTAVQKSKFSGKRCFILTLRPNDLEPKQTSMKVWVDKKKWWLLQVETTESNGDVTTYTIKEHQKNKKIDPSLFSFAVPVGADIIDHRSLIDEEQ